MTKILAITPSFTAWRRAADRLLALETMLALSKRAVPPGPVPQRPQEPELAQARTLAGQLFEVALAETQQARHVNAPAVHA
jgi:hypothetical protein